MTNTLDTPQLQPESPAPRRNTTTIVLAVVAVVAVMALATVGIVAITSNDGTDSHSGMMGNSTHSMMDTNDMMGGSSMNGMGHAASNPTIPGAREVAVTATSFNFTPNEVHLRAGEDVTIALTATDLGHDFIIDELDFHVAAEPGTIGRGGLHAPTTPGRYTAYRSVAGHRAAGMTATVIVDES
jgi:heme/copper-type cytochrome/quinol oxidase subunit 2